MTDLMDGSIQRPKIDEPTVKPNGCTIRRGFKPSERYEFDWGLCSAKNGWAQIDTKQDASYYGQWANPGKLQVFSYVEGDLILVEAPNAEAFVAEIREMAQWTDERGWGPLKIDPSVSNTTIADRFRELGLGDLLH